MSENKDKPLYVTDPEQWLKETAHTPDLFVIIIFRGAWCKYDKHYLRKLGYFHTHTMKKENVGMIAWTSQGAEAAKQADKEWGLTRDFGYDQVIGDETNALAKYLVEDEVLPGLKTVTPQEIGVQDLVPEGSYPNGLVLPGMVVYAHHGTITLQWEMEPPGGPNRPDPAALWEILKKRKHALDHGNAVMPAHDPETKMCTTDLEVTLSSCNVL